MNPYRLFSQGLMRQLIQGLTLATLSASLTTLPVAAYQRLHFIYPPINRSLGIDSLTLFAEEGIVNRELEDYLNLAGVNDQQKAEFREALRKKAPVDPIQLSRFLNSSLGESILERLGVLISIRGGRNGKYAIRGAMVKAALDPQEGLTVLNVFRNLAVDMQFNLDDIFITADYIDLLGRGTDGVVEEMKRLAAMEANNGTPVNFSTLPDLRQPGSYGVAPERIWQLKDESRDRNFDALVIQPQRWREGKNPVVIISHGLASRPEDFADRAKQLASYGYLVVLPRHIGSDTRQLQAMLDGFSREVYKVSEFIDRPLDISYVIDELERRNNPEFQGRLDLQNVGVMGHSFGGYTALAVAGASLDFATLENQCSRRIWGPNLSLLLQCQALELPRKEYNFRDERVTSILIINPVTSAIFGQKGLNQVKIPVMIGAGSSDPATPAAVEQLKAFVWINTDDKYLLLVEGQAHVNFSKLDASTKALIDSLPNLQVPKQEIIDSYGNALLPAFSEVYVAKNEAFRPFLTSAYGKYISEQPNALHLVQAEADVPLSELFNRLKPEHFPAIYSPRISNSNP